MDEALKAKILKIAGIPQSIEVALDAGLIVNVAGTGKDSGFDAVSRNPAVPVNSNIRHQVLLGGAKGNQQPQQEGRQQTEPAAPEPWE